MSQFQDQMAADAANVFCNANDFGESVLFTPLDPTSGNAIRTINAIVVRDPPTGLPANENWSPPKMLVHVTNDPVLGVSSEFLDTGGDTITVAYRIGTSSQVFQVRLPEPSGGEMQDSAMLTLELR